jgi:hypothetical protein
MTSTPAREETTGTACGYTPGTTRNERGVKEPVSRKVMETRGNGMDLRFGGSCSVVGELISEV